VIEGFKKGKHTEGSSRALQIMDEKGIQRFGKI